jgi:hypothetical protein
VADETITEAGIAVAADRERLGRLVHETRLAWWAERYPGLVFKSWEQRTPHDREFDMRAAEAAAAAERERIREMAVRNNAVCVGDEGTSCYFADLIREPSWP